MLALVSSISDGRDPVSAGSLWMNRLLAAIGVAIVVSAFAEAPGSSHFFYVAVLVLAQLLVTLLGEVDVRWVSSSIEEARRSTPAGRLQRLSEKILGATHEEAAKAFADASSDIPTDSARTQLETFLAFHSRESIEHGRWQRTSPAQERLETLAWQAGVASCVQLENYAAADRLLQGALHGATRNSSMIEDVRLGVQVRLGEALAIWGDGRRQALGTELAGTANKPQNGLNALVPEEVKSLLQDLYRFHSRPAKEVLADPRLAEWPLGLIVRSAKALSEGRTIEIVPESASSTSLEALSWLLLADDQVEVALSLRQRAGEDPANSADSLAYRRRVRSSWLDRGSQIESYPWQQC